LVGKGRRPKVAPPLKRIRRALALAVTAGAGQL
jgi:hypothetical protein